MTEIVKAFSNPTFLFSNQTNYFLVFFLLEVLNNIIQYQFDGNCNLVYTIIRKRLVFFNLLNLQTDQKFIDDALAKIAKKTQDIPESKTSSPTSSSHSISSIASPIETAASGSPRGEQLNQGEQISVLKTTLAETPSISKMTENTISSMNDSTPVERPKMFEKNTNDKNWSATSEWISSWKSKLPLQTLMRLLQVLGNQIIYFIVINLLKLISNLVPQVEKICIDKGLTDESEILKFLQNGTLVGLLPVPHPILIRKYQPNLGTIMWLKTYMWGVIYLRC